VPGGGVAAQQVPAGVLQHRSERRLGQACVHGCACGCGWVLQCEAQCEVQCKVQCECRRNSMVVFVQT
jgi:hypothetical protein